MADPFVTTPSVQTTKPQGVQRRPKVSPAERDYLVTHGNSILQRGGTEEDVANFTRIFVGLEPEHRQQKVATALDTASGDTPTPRVQDNLISGLTLKALQGATFGFGDEAVGSLIGFIDPTMTAAEGTEEFRQRLEDTSAEHPVASFLAELGGGVLGAMAGGAVLGAAGKGLQGARGAAGLAGRAMSAVGAPASAGLGTQVAAGAGGGAIAGAGYAEGDISARAKAALFGGTLGAFLGAGLAGASALAEPLKRGASRSFANVSERFARLMPSAGTPTDAALAEMVDILEKDGLTIAQLWERAANMKRQGVNPTMADVAGPRMLGLLSQNLRNRTPAKQQLAEVLLTRQADQGERLLGELFQRVMRSDEFGLNNAYHAIDDLQRLKQAAARPLYQQAYQEVVEVTPKMKALLQNEPRLRAAWEHAKRIADSEDILDPVEGALALPDLPSGSLLQAARQQLIDLGASEEVIQSTLSQLPDDFPATLPIRGLDLMKKGLNRVEEALHRRGSSIDKAELRPLRQALEEMLEEVDAQVPVYGEARRVFGGVASAQDAVVAGQQGFMKKAPEIVEKEIAELMKSNPSLADFYRLGAIQELRDHIYGTLSRSENADVARRVFGGRILRNPDGQDARRIQALFSGLDNGREAAQEFMRKVVAETRLSQTSESVGSLVPRSVGSGDEVMEMLKGDPAGIRMNAVLTLLSAARDRVVKGGRKFNERVADELAVLFTQGVDTPRQFAHLLERLEDIQLRLMRESRRKTVTRIGTRAAVGAEAGDLVGN